jgi:FixJ family two-component response regulator
LSALDLATTIAVYLELALIMENIATQIVVAVDDDFRVRESLKSLIESAGYSPMLFSSAEEFLQSGRLTATTCVITDVRMAGMGGIELQRRIRLQYPTLPVVFITAHNSSDEIRQKALAEGAVGFLYKPFNAADLLEVIQAASANSRGETGTIPQGVKRCLHSI